MDPYKNTILSPLTSYLICFENNKIFYYSILSTILVYELRGWKWDHLEKPESLKKKNHRIIFYLLHHSWAWESITLAFISLHSRVGHLCTNKLRQADSISNFMRLGRILPRPRWTLLDSFPALIIFLFQYFVKETSLIHFLGKEKQCKYTDDTFWCEEKQ